MKTSKKFALIKPDLIRVAKNAAIFLAPALLVFLTSIKAGLTVREAMFAVYLWALNTSIDLLRKFTEERKYK